MIVTGAPVFLTLGAAAIVGVIALFRASGSWKGKSREDMDRQVEKYTK